MMSAGFLLAVVRVSETFSILLVEDNEDDVAILRRLIRRLPGNYRVDVAYTGADGVACAESRRFDVALVDHHLPDESGEVLLQRLSAVCPELPVVVLTGHGDERLAVQVMKAGAYDYLRKGDLDQSTLQRTLHNVRERVRLEQQVRDAHERLRQWALRDGLTGLYNHRHFQQLLRSEFLRARRYGLPLACMMIDVDHFKQVNDTHGHPFGDEVLRSVSQILVEQAREVDILARYGGEEFIVVLPNTDRSGARQAAERILGAVSGREISDERSTIRVTVSIGVAVNDDTRITEEAELIRQADAAMYEAKHAGRNGVRMAGETSVGTAPPEQPSRPAPSTTDVQSEVRRRMISGLSELLQIAERSAVERGHSRRVSAMATAFGEFLDLGEGALDQLACGALLHDIGRVGISDAIWHKPGLLTDAERAETNQHPVFGERLLLSAGFGDPERAIVRHHHERWDGNGYPDGLSGEEIPRFGRVVAICDAFEALTSERPWREARPRDVALQMIEDKAGEAYDPDLVDRFREFLLSRAAAQVLSVEE